MFAVLTDELSLDPAIRSSPYVEPPENEVVMPTIKKVGIRLRRIIILIFHLLALLGVYYCAMKQVKVLTISWGKCA